MPDMILCPHCMAVCNAGIRLCPACGRPMQCTNGAHQLPIGTFLNKRYLVGCAIGGGGFGITYVGYDTLLNIKVAIKEYYPSGAANRSSTAKVYPTSGGNGSSFETGKERFLNEAAILTARDGGKKIGMPALEEAITRVQMGPEKRSRVITDADKKLTAYHEAGHAIVAMKLQNCDPVHEVSIIPRGMAGGYTMMLPKEDKNYVTRGKLEDSIAMSLGGRVAEKLRMGDISTGAYSDLQAATQTAQKMVTEYGMSEDIGPIFLGGQTEVFIGRDWGHQRNYSESLAARVDAEVQRILQEQFLRAEKAVGADMEALDRVANMLMEYERVTGEEFAAVYHGADPKDVIKPETTQDTAAETVKTSADTEAEQTVQTAETTEDNAEAEPTEER